MPAVANTEEFFELVMYAWEEVVYIFNLCMANWYLRLLFVVGLIWLVFDCFEEVSNIYHENRRNEV